MVETALPVVFQLAPVQTVLIVLSAFGAAVFAGVSGFAGGLFLTICLAPIVGVKPAVPVVAVAIILGNSTRLWAYRDAVNWGAYRAIMVPAFPGIVVGALVYTYLPVAWIALILGLFMIATVPLRRVLEGRSLRIGRRELAVVGSGFGILAGTTVGAGMILVPFLLGAGIAGEGLIGTIAAVGWTLNVTKTAVFGSSELLDLNMFISGVLVGLFTIPGTYAGRWIVTHTPVRIHTVVLEVLIVCGGGYFLWKAARAFGALP